MVTVDRLYELYNIVIDSKDKASEHEGAYKEIMTASKGNAAERRLSSQFIAKFFIIFPNLQEQALNCLFDLCEDADSSIRKQAIKDLPVICKEKKEIIPKVSDILAQLLQMEDPAEISTIQNSLTLLFKLDAKATLTGLFYQIENSEDELVRERGLKFLENKIKTLGSEVFKTDSEELIFKEAKTVLQDASEEEFLTMMAILKELKCCKTLKGYQQLVDLVTEQCDLTRPLDTTDIESIHRLLSCLKECVPFFSISSKKFVDYMCKEVLPFLNQIEANDHVSADPSSSLTLDFLKVLAELLPSSKDVEDAGDKVISIFTLLVDVMPLPPDGEVTAQSLESGISLEFSRVECLLYIFHQLARHTPEFLSENPERLKDFRLRLQYFARVCQAYQKKLRESLSGKTEGENKIAHIALKTTVNINTLIKDLFHQPPSYKSTIGLSWKDKKTAKGEKRHTPITFESSPTKVARSDRAIYAPPKDKYSSSAGQFGRGRGWGTRRGSFRGRRF